MPKNTKFLAKLEELYPNYHIHFGKKFMFRPPKTIYFGPKSTPNFEFFALHELAHAELGHFNFKTDVERIKMEVAAWGKTKELCQKFGVEFDSSLAEEELDSYRNWLHQKSLCKKCGLTRYQTPNGTYHCPHCDL